MKNIFKIVIAGAFMLSAPVVQADDDVTLQLKWVTQAQFAGYYVALDKGFYKDEGLNVTISLVDQTLHLRKLLRVVVRCSS